MTTTLENRTVLCRGWWRQRNDYYAYLVGEVDGIWYGRLGQGGGGSWHDDGRTTDARMHNDLWLYCGDGIRPEIKGA